MLLRDVSAVVIALFCFRGASASHAQAASNRSFVPGAICEATQTYAPLDKLRGRHLIVGEMVWEPFAFRDSSTPSGWAGFDLDLLDHVAADLGFTYEIFDMTANALPEETWDEQLYRLSAQTDLVMSYWSATYASRVSQLLGHMDYGTVLVVRPGEDEEPPFVERMFTFFNPFSGELWGAIIAIVLLSGLIDNLLERRHGGSLQESLYEAFAGTMWGGFERPRSNLSAVYQIVLSLVLLITISAYTANLAAFLTIKGSPTLSANSVSDLIGASKPVCCRDDDPMLDAYRAYFPELTYRTMPIEDLPRAVNSGLCDAAFMPNINLKKLKNNDAENCMLTVAESPIAASAGWATNFQSPCIQQSIDYCLQRLKLDGTLNAVLLKWLYPLPCEVESNGEADADEVRRHLTSAAYIATSRLSGAAAQPQRRLKSSSASRAAISASSAGGSADEGSDEQQVIGIREFAGVLILWGAVSAATLLGSVVYHNTPTIKVSLQSPQVVAASQTMATAGLDKLFGTKPPANPANTDNEITMLRLVLEELAPLRKIALALEEASSDDKGESATSASPSTKKTSLADIMVAVPT